MPTECACSESSPRSSQGALALARLLYELTQLFETGTDVEEQTQLRRASAAGFGDLLKRHRRRAGLTQEELAERAALSTRTISDLERGSAHVPRRDTVLLLSEGLALSHQQRTEFEASVSRRRGPRARSTIRPFARFARA